jgi:hypothetical protein
VWLTIPRDSQSCPAPQTKPTLSSRLRHMRARRRWVVTLSIVFLLLAIPVVGLTDAFGTAGHLQAQLGGWSSDGATHDTFWDSPVFDIPGVSVTAVHCHGKVRYDLQVGATGPSHSNPCYAAMGAYGYGSAQSGVFMSLAGNSAVYRISQNYGPWRYCIGSLTPFPGPGAGFAPPGPPSFPC